LKSYFFITFAGLPTATQKSGILLVTTELAPITVFLPIVTPGNIVELHPMKEPSFINTGWPSVAGWLIIGIYIFE